MRAVLVLALLLPIAAGAQTVTLSKFPPNPGVMPGGGFEFKSNSTFADPPPQRAWVNGTYGSVPGARAVDSLTVRGPAGDLPLKVGRTVSNKAIGVAAASVAARALPQVAVGVALWDIWDNLSVRPDGSGGLVEDPGQPPADVLSYECKIGNRHRFTSSTVWGACSQTLEAEKASFTDPFYGTNKAWTNQSNCQISVDPNAATGGCARTFLAGGAGTLHLSASWEKKLIKQCPAVVDFSNPIYTVPGGPAKPDGKCPTGRYNRPLSFDQAGTKFSAYPPSDPSSVARDVIDRGAEIDATPGGIEGPATQTGTPTSTTTTNPDGTSKTETKTPSYQYSYGPSSVTYNTTVTTVINNAGNITTTTTTTNNTPKQDPEDPCVKNPDTVGCAKMDQPSGPELEKQEKPVSVTPDAGWGADAGSCPAPIQATVLGQAVTIDNTLVCQFLSGVRFAVIGMCGLAATLIFLGGFREST